MKVTKNTTLKRVKVYLLTDVWVDNGTGYCFAEISEENQPYLVVKNELDESDELLRAKIEGSIQFQRQQETLIVWSDSNGQNIALSFQEKAGCASLCNFLIKVNRESLAPLISLVYILPSDSDGVEISEFITGPINYPNINPTCEDLIDIFQKLNENPSSSYQRECIVNFITNNDYIKKLTKLFEESENNRKIKNLHILCNIIKTMILFNEVSIIELMLEDDTMMDIVGILEYDPDFPLFKSNHRSYLKDDSKFKEILPIKVEDIKQLIIKTFKLQFLKDVVLARLLDDPTFNFISTLIHFNQVKIMQFLERSNFIDELFEIYSYDGDMPKKEDGIKLIHQFILISKNLQPHQKTNLYRSLVKKGLLKTIKFVLDHGSIELRVLSTEVLVSIIEHDVLLVSTCNSNDDEDNEKKNNEAKNNEARNETNNDEEDDNNNTHKKIAARDSFKNTSEPFNPDDYGNDSDEDEGEEDDDSLISILDESPLVLSDDMTLLSILTEFLLDDNAPGLRIQSFEALKSLLDPIANLNAPNPISQQIFIEKLDTESYFNAFYLKVAPKLFKPLIDSSNDEIIDSKKDDLFIHLCELINFCTKDKLISRSFFLENHILLGISKLINSNHKLQLRLASIRSIKSIILLNDDYYIRYIISNDLFKNIFEFFEISKDSENLIYSTILDLLENILLKLDKNESELNLNNFKLLANYIVKNYESDLVLIKSMEIGEDLIKFVKTGQIRKKTNDIDFSLEYEDSINDSIDQDEYNDEQESDNTSESADEDEENDKKEKKLKKVTEEELKTIQGELDETAKGDKQVSFTNLVKVPKKKDTLKSKISNAGKKIASKFSK